MASALGTTTITFSDPSNFDDWVFGNDAGGSDATVFSDSGSLTINVAAVPEPSSFLFLGLILVSGGARKRYWLPLKRFLAGTLR